MTGIAKKADPRLWNDVKRDVTQEGKGGKPGQWSARKAQIAVQRYKSQGGGYAGGKQPDNHLVQWTREDWGTASGAESGRTGERYLPKKARAQLDDAEYRRTTAKKRVDTAKGKQFSRQPADVAQKTSRARRSGSGEARTRTDLLAEAARHGVPGRSRMNKAELQKALKGLA